ncbi:hypothetical protein U6V07_12160, partial [Cutibacterium acnes]
MISSSELHALSRKSSKSAARQRSFIPGLLSVDMQIMGILVPDLLSNALIFAVHSNPFIDGILKSMMIARYNPGLNLDMALGPFA